MPHYPPYVKTFLKTGAILHLLLFATGSLLVAVRLTHIRRNGRGRRQFYKAGKFDSALQVRDERHREVIRPLMILEPADISSRVFEHFAEKRLD
jgi:hypothetical protein